MVLLGRLGTWNCKILMACGYDMQLYPTSSRLVGTIDEMIGEESRDFLDLEDVEHVTISFDDECEDDDYCAPW